MKKESRVRRTTEILEEYDFRGGVRGKYVARFQEGSNLVLLAPDVAEVFPDAESVNKALRTLMERPEFRRTPASGES
jgi:hypothetical protein